MAAVETLSSGATSNSSSSTGPNPTTVTTAPTNENPVPSITLSITQEDVKRVLEASEALTRVLKTMKEKEQQEEQQSSSKDETDSPLQPVIETKSEDEDNSSPSSEDTKGSQNTTQEQDDDDTSGEPPLRTVSCDDEIKDGDGTSNTTTHCKRPLHTLVYEAARQCDNTMLKSFLERMKNSGSSSSEIRAGVMVFSDIDLTSKIQHIFDVLGGDCTTPPNDQSDVIQQSLSRDGALSLFRAVIVAISSCIHKNACLQIEIDKDTEPPASKRRKPNTPDDTKDNATQNNQAPPSGADSIPSLQSPSASFDSSCVHDDFIASQVRKEFQEIAMFARDRLVRYAQKKTGNKNLDTVVITFSLFQEWRRAEGARIAPWLDLLDLTKWKTPHRSTDRSTSQQQQQPLKPKTQLVQSQQPPHQQEEEDQQVQNSPSLTPTQVKPEPADSSTKTPKERVSPSQQCSTFKENEAPATANSAVKPRQETPSTSQSQATGNQTPLFLSENTSRTILSFDFSASLPGSKNERGFVITITEENLRTFRNLVRSTGLMTRSCQEIASIIWEASKKRSYQSRDIKVIPIERFHTCLHQLLGSGASRRLSKMERDIFSSCFVDFFACFTTAMDPLDASEALASELVVGFSFLCSGNKSTKLVSGFDMLEYERGRGLTNEQLVHFLRSYLTMLAGISFLTSSADGIMKPKLNANTRKIMCQAVENGARWTVSHFLKPLGIKEDDTRARHTFDSFASWYSSGGYNVAPWLELLDLNKLLSLVPEEEIMMKSPKMTNDALPSFPEPKTSSPEFEVSPHPLPRRTPSRQRASCPLPLPVQPTMGEGTPINPFLPTPTSHILFTFPLANQCSLVVLREDASYVRSVVEKLGLISLTPEDLWSKMLSIASNRPVLVDNGHKKSLKNSHIAKNMIINKEGFMETMQQAVGGHDKHSKKRTASGLSKTGSNFRDILVNFFQSFDLLQCDRVALNELMGGLTLLCDGKKSTKLSFAFSVFDRRAKKKGKKVPSPNSLDGEELFLFLRSFLIVMFSCCRQSWDLTDDMVNRYIADTANMVAEDVIRYQWRTRKKERVDFDEFGQWYNEGGFELAPWLELLDLKKWVLVDSFEDFEKQRPPPLSPGIGLMMTDADCPPPPPDAEVDPSFFDDDAGGIMPMDSMDEMDLLLMPQTSHDKDDLFSKAFPFSPKPSPKPQPPQPSSNAIKFHILTRDNHDGYVVSVSQKRIRRLRHLLIESGLNVIDGEQACREILGMAQRDGKSRSGSTFYSLTKQDFDAAVVRVITSTTMSVQTQTTLTTILREIFNAFDVGGTGKADAFDVACGFAVLCRGKKSDKLEYAFEILDRDKQGFLSREDTIRYLRSFLVVLLTIVTTSSVESDHSDDCMTTMSGEKCDMSMASISRAIELGCRWASDQAMKSSSNDDALSFDDFAAWYTRIGYGNIPWLELLDLSKWILNVSPGEATHHS
ncbi:EF hand domain containing protein [Nitzschia inconspicua]|uniref:EF hand domain containing protein n=1 Tax=Nitzschia inconspicua TaxID=303405 RepID=A0A9K3L7S6_9STRA|nr:EF hand domain containing protein [Nitzschia inconspicua]